MFEVVLKVVASYDARRYWIAGTVAVHPRRCRDSLRFCSELKYTSASECLNLSNHSPLSLTPAVPYVYLRPSGAGCFCAASAMGSDMMNSVCKRRVRDMNGTKKTGGVK